MRALHTYSLVKALYDQGRDYIDAFWPFLLQVMPRDGKALAAAPAADRIREQFGLTVPVHTVQTLAERAKRHLGYLSRENNAYSLTREGVEYLAKMETPRQVERRIEALLNHAVAALSKKNELFADREFTLD